MMQPVTVIKCDPGGKETWRYTGQVLERKDHSILLEARFNRTDLPFHGVLLRKGDRFLETYYADRWYNIYEVHDVETDRLKCWYCNISFPAEISPETVSFRDLALDLLVYPDGKQLVLDEDEFEALDLTPEIKEKAREALVQVQSVMEKAR